MLRNVPISRFDVRRHANNVQAETKPMCLPAFLGRHLPPCRHVIRRAMPLVIYICIYTRIPVAMLPDSSPPLVLRGGSVYGPYE